MKSLFKQMEGGANRPFSRSDQPNNPAVQVNIFQNDKLSFQGWSFLRYPEFHGSRDAGYLHLLRGQLPFRTPQLRILSEVSS